MKKHVLKIFLLALAFILSQPKADAQPLCPIEVYNNATRIGLNGGNLYFAVQGGSYTLTMITSGLPGMECWLVDAPVTVIKSQDIRGAISGNTGSGGSGIYFDIGAALVANGCNNTLPVDPNDWKAIQQGSTSILLKPVPGGNGNVVITLNITDYNADDCELIVVPVFWGPYSAQLISGPKVRIDWNTQFESNVDHFSIEKSSNGSNIWRKIGQVPATGFSGTPVDYFFIDDYPNNDALYRIISVDVDCRRQYTPQSRRVTCSGCPGGNSVPGGIPADCPPPPNPSPYITGPSSICDLAPTIYRLYNVTGDAQVTWSISPSWLANLTQVSRTVGLVPTGGEGIGTLTATVVKNGVTSHYNYQIMFGVPDDLSGWCQTGPEDGSGAYELTAFVNMWPGTNPSDYHWYQDGFTHMGSGNQWTWLVLPGETIYYDVRYFGPCGNSVWFGTSLGCGTWAKGAPSPRVTLPVTTSSVQYKLLQNPARGNISIQRIEPPSGLKSASSQAITIRIFDVQGALRKTSKASANSTKLSINGSDLPAGLYFVHITEEGKETVTLKVLLEK